MQYIAFVQRDEPEGYRATLPDFPGCSARAASWLQMEDAIRMAVRLHVETLDSVPPPTPIELLTEDSAPPNSCCMFVSLFAHEVQRPECVVPRRRLRGAREAMVGTGMPPADRTRTPAAPTRTVSP